MIKITGIINYLKFIKFYFDFEKDLAIAIEEGTKNTPIYLVEKNNFI